MAHLGIIPDGNRRWCKKNKLQIESLIDYWINDMTLIWMKNLLKKENKFINIFKINELSLYVSSIDNLSRKDNSFKLGFELIRRVDKLFKNLDKLFESDDINKIKKVIKNIKINLIGNKDKIPEDIKNILKEYNSDDKNAFIINLAIAYDCIKDITETPKDGYVREQKNIDIVFRSGGELRLSGFFPTKTIYSELYFLDKLWPETKLTDLEECMAVFFKRKRRFGK